MRVYLNVEAGKAAEENNPSWAGNEKIISWPTHFGEDYSART
jgi:hypothetical protein